MVAILMLGYKLSQVPSMVRSVLSGAMVALSLPASSANRVPYSYNHASGSGTCSNPSSLQSGIFRGNF